MMSSATGPKKLTLNKSPRQKESLVRPNIVFNNNLPECHGKSRTHTTSNKMITMNTNATMSTVSETSRRNSRKDFRADMAAPLIEQSNNVKMMPLRSSHDSISGLSKFQLVDIATLPRG